MKLTDAAAIAVAVVAVVFLGGPDVDSNDADIPKPPTAVQQTVAPVTAVLEGHPDEARQLAAFYHAAADAVRRDGSGMRILTNTKDLRSVLVVATALRFQGAFQQISGLSDAIHGPNGALATLLGLDVATLDHQQAADAIDAVAWACREAAR